MLEIILLNNIPSSLDIDIYFSFYIIICRNIKYFSPGKSAEAFQAVVSRVLSTWGLGGGDAGAVYWTHLHITIDEYPKNSFQERLAIACALAKRRAVINFKPTNVMVGLGSTDGTRVLLRVRAPGQRKLPLPRC